MRSLPQPSKRGWMLLAVGIVLSAFGLYLTILGFLNLEVQCFCPSNGRCYCGGDYILNNWGIPAFSIGIPLSFLGLAAILIAFTGRSGLPKAAGFLSIVSAIISSLITFLGFVWFVAFLVYRGSDGLNSTNPYTPLTTGILGAIAISAGLVGGASAFTRGSSHRLVLGLATEGLTALLASLWFPVLDQVTLPVMLLTVLGVFFLGLEKYGHIIPTTKTNLPSA